MKKPLSSLLARATAFASAAIALPLFAAFQMENLGRGLVALRVSESEVFLSWRLLGTDDPNAAFAVYRSDNDGYAYKISGPSITDSTNFVDRDAPAGITYQYYVRATEDGVKQPPSQPYTLGPSSEPTLYKTIPLNKPAGGTSPDNTSYTYTANDCSVGDLDNDGEYEIIVKWDPTNSQDNSKGGHTGNAYLDAYEFDGTQLWRIDLGVNVRAGAHYTQFLVYDFDGDGQAELACRTCEGSKDGKGEYIAKADRFAGERPPIDHTADRRNGSGYILSGPEFITVFDGKTGAELATTLYQPQRVPGTFFPSVAQTQAIWGDNYGNRMDRFLATVAYLDGEYPSMVFCRGYYTGQNGTPGRTALAAFDWRDGQLTQRWIFDTYQKPENDAYRGQGAHSVTVGDVDGDGKDEIVYGACAIDDDGTGLYSTGIGHGDALHLSDMDPNRPGQEVWMPHETPSLYGPNGSELHDARTGTVLYSVSGENADVGRGMAADIDPRHVGYETWASRGGLTNAGNVSVSTRRPSSINFAVYWDGDLLREILDGTTISKWDWTNERLDTLLSATGALSNNSTKATPNLSADLFGDWREEVVWRDTTSENLRVYSTTIPTSHRIKTLMHDRQYRLAIAWQNVGYNQPPHPGFYLGNGMAPVPAVGMRPTGNGENPDAVPLEQRIRNWLAEGGVPAQTDPQLDPEGNGLSLEAEYAFDLTASLTGKSIIQTTKPDLKGDVTFTIPTPRDEYDYVVERSKDLENWETVFVVLGLQPTLTFQGKVEEPPFFYRLTLDDHTDYQRP